MMIVLDEIAPGLYEIGPITDGQPAFAYYLLVDAGGAPPSPTLEDTWDDPELPGWYLCIGERVLRSDAPAFASAARAQLPALFSSPARLNPRGLVWLSDEGACASPTASLLFYQLLPSQPTRAPFRTFTLTWGGTDPQLGLGLQISGSVSVQLDAGNGAIQIVTTPSGVTQIQWLYNGQPQQNYVVQYPGSGWLISVPLTGGTAGALTFDLAFDYGQLYSCLGCGFTYAYPASGGAATLSYPFAVGSPNPNISTFLGVAIRLHPLFPTVVSQTMLALDLDGPLPYSQNSRSFAATCFSTTNGGSVTLTPVVVDAAPGGSPDGEPPLAPGFALCRSPLPGAGASPGDYRYSLVPVGTFQIAATIPPGRTVSRRPAKRSKKALAAGAGPVQIQCGLSAQEFLSLQLADIIELLPARPAFAPGFSLAAAGADVTETLAGDFTTSWLRLLPPAPAARGYFGQPSASVYYAETGDGAYPAAVTSLLSTLPDPVAFPMVPYGGVVPDAAAAAAYAALEAAVFSTVRHGILARNVSGPVFGGASPPVRRRSRRRGVSLVATAPASAVTPQGLITRLNPDGTWATVELALSPDVPDQFLAFGPAPDDRVVSPPLATVLLQDQLFLVVSVSGPLGSFASLLSMSGFNFLLDVSPTTTILIFKYNTSLSLSNLVAQPSLWADPATFVGGSPDAVESTQQAILESIATAADLAGASGDPFGAFNRLVDDPAWTGILALGSAIDGNGMPPDLAMLLGGIPGQLRAHHLGIEANRIGRTGGLHIDQSSLFGVIYYQDHTPPSTTGDFTYAVETLVAVFANSKLSQLTVEVGLTINTLFGREVLLVSDGDLSPPPPPNTLVISGQYQSQDGVGTVTFQSDTPFVYVFPTGIGGFGSPAFDEGPGARSRVLRQVRIDHASLVPVSGAAGSPHGGAGPQAVQASFRLGGEIWFTPDPFPGCDIDLFSYGVLDSPNVGAPFSNLTVNVSFTLSESGALVPGSETVQFLPQLLMLDPTETCIRPNSLLNSLPMQLSQFRYAPSGMSPASEKAQPVHVLELEGMGKTGSPPPPRAYPYVTTAPQYGLEFDLPLGSLGALSDVHAGLTAKLILGWGPSPIVPECDAAAVLVQLPQAMAGYGGFNLQGILQTTFGDANLLRVDLPRGPVYAVLFNNIKLSVFGFSFPPGVLVDFTIFAGQPDVGQAANASNIAWFLAATQPGASPPHA
ncbi:MAG: hypothetical protein ACRD26_18950 [Vicinamibacterales bacterium]